VRSWLPEVGVLAAVLATFVLPGVLGLLTLGVRGLGAVLAAPPVSVATYSFAAVACGLVGVPYSGWAAVAAVVLLVMVASGVGALLRRRGRHEPGREPAVVLGWTAVGLVVAMFLGARSLMRGMGGPDRLSQAWDVVFHLNAVRLILDEGDASPLLIAGVANTTGDPGIYPSGWHVSVATATMIGPGADLGVYSNAAAIVIAAVVWPGSLLWLARTTWGTDWRVGLVAPVLAVGYVAFPVSMLAFGVLWPNALAYAFVPILLAVTAVLLGLSRQPPVTWATGVVVLIGVFIGTGSAHPNALFAFGYLALPMVVLGVVRWSQRRWQAGAIRAAILMPVVLVAASVAGYLAISRSRIYQGVTDFRWPSVESRAQAVGEALLDSTLAPRDYGDRTPAWALATLAVVGCVAALRKPGLQWLPFSYVVAIYLFAVAAGPDAPERPVLAGVFYGDPVRVAGLTPLVGALAATIGLIVIANRLEHTLAVTWSSAGPRRWPMAFLVTPVLLIAVVLVTGGLYAEARRNRVEYDYVDATPGTGRSLVTPEERLFLAGLAETVPEGEVVAANPFSGGALAYALGGTTVLFPHLTGSWDADRELVAGRLNRLDGDPAVCSALERLGVRWVYEDEMLYSPDYSGQGFFRGLVDLEDVPGLTAAAALDGITLYRIDGCGR
jgi:hypothetical protein